MDGNIGTSPIAATAITGFGLELDIDETFAASGLVSGNVYAADYAIPTPAKMTQAISDMEAAYVDAAGRPNPETVELGGGGIGGMTLTGGVHKWSTVVTVAVGKKLYFDARGCNDTVWIMQIAGGLNFMANSEVVLLNGAKSSNIFWQVAGVATILADAHAEGIILGATGITFEARGSLNGRGLAQTSVTMLSTTIVGPPPPSPPPSAPALASPPASPPLASVDLGTAEGFALLAKSGITTTGATEVTALSLSLPLARAPTPNPSPYPLPPTPYPYTPTPIPLYP